MANSPQSSGSRRCPLCSGLTTSALCPQDGMATLLEDAPPSRPDRVAPGTIIAGRYRIEQPIGHGGFGTVFIAQHVGTGQKVALKALEAAPSEDNLHLRRFFQEAKVTAGLKHPNTVRVFDFGQDDTGLIYLVMELLNGSTLRQEIVARRKSGRTFSQEEVSHIGAEICSSLIEAHDIGLVHRDLKPDNIMLQPLSRDETMVKVLDFGIAKVMDASLTKAGGASPGTPYYMSPQQCLSEKITPQSDIYSLGIILYEMIAGRPPFRGDQVVQILYHHVHTEAPSLNEVAQSQVDSQFVEVIEKAIAKTSADRFKDARALRDSLVRDRASSSSLPIIELEHTPKFSGQAHSGGETTVSRPGSNIDTMKAESVHPLPEFAVASGPPIVSPFRRVFVVLAVVTFAVAMGMFLRKQQNVATPIKAEKIVPNIEQSPPPKKPAAVQESTPLEKQALQASESATTTTEKKTPVVKSAPSRIPAKKKTRTKVSIPIKTSTEKSKPPPKPDKPAPKEDKSALDVRL